MFSLDNLRQRVFTDKCLKEKKKLFIVKKYGNYRKRFSSVVKNQSELKFQVSSETIGLVVFLTLYGELLCGN
jgi:hypothetical protein